MTKYNGLFLKAKTMAVLVLMAMFVPITIFAQSDQAARVQIKGTDAASFGDILVARDGDDLVLYGLAEAVPAFSVVTIQAGSLESEVRSANFLGKFPTRFEAPIRIAGGVGIATASVLAESAAGTLSGIINLDINSPEVLQNLITYQDLAREGNVIEARTQGVPPHRLLNIVALDAGEENLVGKVLLSQQVVGLGDSAIEVDEIEGLSDGGFDISNRFQSVPEFSGVGVYLTEAAARNDDRTQRIHFIETEQFFEGGFISNGSFLPFSLEDANNLNNENPSVFFRITARQLNGANGQPPRVIIARIDNDIESSVTSSSAVNNNTQGSAGAPGSAGIAAITGVADPYSVITAYSENDRSSDVIAQGIANSSGAFTFVVPGIFNDQGVYTSRQNVFLGSIDVFGNENGLIQVELDTEAVVFTNPSAEDNGDNTFTVSGVAESSSLILVTGMTNNNDIIFHAGNGVADDDGSFAIVVPRAFSYTVSTIDQAGNQSAEQSVNAQQTTADPSGLTALGVFPNIRIAGVVEPNSDVRIFAFPLSSVPDTATVEENQPANSFFVNSTVSDDDGNFSLLVPGSISRIIFVQSIDPLGNVSQFVGLNLDDALGSPISRNLVVFRNLNFVNNPPGVGDVITGTVVDANTETPVADVFVNAFLTAVPSETDSSLPFAEPLSSPVVEVGADGTFQLNIPDLAPLSGEFIESFFLVAMERRLEDFSFAEVGFQRISENEGFDRVGPRIDFAPVSDDLQLLEAGCGENDVLNILNILPAGTGSVFDIPNDALPFIIVIADGDDDAVIDVRSSDVRRVDIKPLDALIGGQFGLGNLPFPGVTGLNLGSNCWDAVNGLVRGNSVVFIALVDAAGNLSPNPLPVFLDVSVNDPNASLITARGIDVFGSQGAVESFSTVSVFSNPDKSGFLGSTQATSTGAFAVSDLSIQESEVYLSVRDQAGNQSNVIRVQVNEPVLPPRASQFLVLDQFGLIHTSASTLSTGISLDNSARALSNVEDIPGLHYVLQADGNFNPVGNDGKLPVIFNDETLTFESEIITIPGKFARDLVVINHDPFQGYVLLGNGMIIAYGGAPFFGDIVTPTDPVQRLKVPNTNLLFEDRDGDGEVDTEDVNGNGVLDISVVFDENFQQVVIREDTNNNGVIDSEIINPANLLQGFENDIARELEVVRNANGDVLGYVILDGFGTLWPFSGNNDISAENVRPTQTSGSFETDLARAFELVVDDNGSILDFIMLSGNGQVFGFPGGLLGAGPVTDADNAGHLTVVLRATNFGFDIARDIRANPDGDGFYILDGFGGVHAIGGAPSIEGSPFLGFDVARDIEFGLGMLR